MTDEEKAWLDAIALAEKLRDEFKAAGMLHSAIVMEQCSAWNRAGLDALREFRQHQPKPL